MRPTSETAVIREKLHRALSEYRAVVSELDAIYRMIDSYPKYMWVKQWDEDSGLYIMLKFSRRYALDLVGPDHGLYEGKSDFDFWPADVARRFFENDERVRLNSMNPQHPGASDVRELFTSPVTGMTADFVGEKWAFESEGETYLAGRGWYEETKTQQ